MNQVTYRGKTTTSLYDFKNTPTGALSFKDGSGVGVYIKIVREPGNGITLIMMEFSK